MNKILEALILGGLATPMATLPPKEAAPQISSSSNHIRALTNDILEIEPRASLMAKHEELLRHNDVYQQEFLRTKMEIFDLASLVYQLLQTSITLLPQATFSSSTSYAEAIELLETLPMDFLSHIVLLSPKDFSLAQLHAQERRLQQLDERLRALVQDLSEQEYHKNGNTLEKHIQGIISSILPETASLQHGGTSLSHFVEHLREQTRTIDMASRPHREALLRKINQSTATERDRDEFFTLLSIDREKLLSEIIKHGGFLPGSEQVLHTLYKLESEHSPECAISGAQEEEKCLSTLLYNAGLQINFNNSFWYHNADFSSEHFYITFLSAQAKKIGYLELSKKASDLL